MESQNQDQETIGGEYADRLKKLEGLKSAGVNPYPAKASRDLMIADLLADFLKLSENLKEIHLCGRLRGLRSHGNLTFANLEDESGTLQIALSKKELGDEQYKRFVKMVDVADFVEVLGTCFVTHKGENSLMIKEWKLLSKALRPIPDSWYGFKDEEDRLRKRYLDILMNPETRELFKKKAAFWDVSRDFMKRHGFFEVETPTIETTTGGAEANPFKTHHDDFDLDVFLRISVGELWQKRLMAAGFEKTFEIGRVYRNEGSSMDHLQEFTNLEFYWAYANYNDGMKLAQELYQEIAQRVFGTTKFSTKGMTYDLSGEWPKIDYRDTVLEKTGIDVLKASEKKWRPN